MTETYTNNVFDENKKIYIHVFSHLDLNQFQNLFVKGHYADNIVCYYYDCHKIKNECNVRSYKIDLFDVRGSGFTHPDVNLTQ